MGFFDVQSDKSSGLRDYAFAQTSLGKSGPKGQLRRAINSAAE